MLGQTPAALLPAVQEAMDAVIMTVAEDAFAYRHQLAAPRGRRDDPGAGPQRAAPPVR
jgi:hypothetical protein